MSSFINDPEAQRRYQERFGQPEHADEEGLYVDEGAQAAYEASGFRESPSVRMGSQQTWDEIRLAQRPAAASPFPEGAVFAEPSALYSRLSARVRGEEPFSLSGDDPFLSS